MGSVTSWVGWTGLIRPSLRRQLLLGVSAVGGDLICILKFLELLALENVPDCRRFLKIIYLRGLLPVSLRKWVMLCHPCSLLK